MDRYFLYLISYGIYSHWPIIFKPVHRTETPVERRSSQRQETVRKYVKRMFGVLQSLSDILGRKTWYWDLEEIICITKTCVILHNLIVRMQHNVAFSNESAKTDIIMESYELERLTNIQSQT